MRVRGRWAFVTVALLALVLIGSALAATAGHRDRTGEGADHHRLGI